MKENKWDLSTIYVDRDSFNQDYNLVKENIKKLVSLEKNMLKNAQNFYQVIDLSMKTEGLIDKLYAYVSLLFDEDTSVNKNLSFKEQIISLYNQYVKDTCFISNNILKLSNKDLKNFYQDEPRLKEYDKYFQDILRYQPYQLTDAEEKLLSSMNALMGNNYQTYELMKDCDMTFDEVKDVDDKILSLDNNNFSLYIKSNDQILRKNAFYSLYKSYANYQNTYANLLYNHLKEEVKIANIKKYSSSLEASLFHDELTEEIYDNLIDTINNNLSYLHKYYKIKKELLQTTTLNVYDVYTSSLSLVEPTYTFEQGKDIVRKALSVLGNEYLSVYDLAFKERWVDVYPQKGKLSGAYSGGSYYTKPFVLLNYQDSYDSVSTLAHEIGHSIHSYFTRQNNPYQYGEYSIVIAEVASTVNELLLARYILDNSNDLNEKKYLLERILELYRTTVFRQTMFAEFEKDIYQIVENNEALTAELLNDKYLELNKKYFGNDVHLNEEIKYEWARIPHFYYHFYVYKYATGLSCAFQIVDKILNHEENAKDNYLEFLKCGKKKNPIDTLKIMGIDITKKEFIESGLKTFDKLLDEFSDLAKM